MLERCSTKEERGQLGPKQSCRKSTDPYRIKHNEVINGMEVLSSTSSGFQLARTPATQSTCQDVLYVVGSRGQQSQLVIQCTTRATSPDHVKLLSFCANIFDPWDRVVQCSQSSARSRKELAMSRGTDQEAAGEPGSLQWMLTDGGAIYNVVYKAAIRKMENIKLQFIKPCNLIL